MNEEERVVEEGFKRHHEWVFEENEMTGCRTTGMTNWRGRGESGEGGRG